MTMELLQRLVNIRVLLLLICLLVESTRAFLVINPQSSSNILRSASATETVDDIDFEALEDAVVLIKPKAMKRLRELKTKQA
jgi:hypothetical protein